MNSEQKPTIGQSESDPVH